ncbi:MAG: metallophosphoesterase, partial [Oscillospiraceae bacterium]|nr:metallophosphoesterase [Oscillospiraceae bacterium]
MTENGVFELRAEGPLRLALFTDLHYNGFAPFSAALTNRLMRKNVRKLSPGLVAVLGDTAIKPDNRGRTRAFVRVMDGFGIPWTAVLGNHEGEHGRDLPRREVIEYYKASGNFLGGAELPGVEGYGNQAIAVTNAGGRAAQLLYFLDSGGGRKGHGHIQPGQLDWMARAASDYPGAPGILFLHVPIEQYQDAYEAWQRGGAALLHGALHEKICPGGTREQGGALLARAKALGVRAIVCGHDHLNNFDILWQGMRYIYAQSSGYSLRVYGVPPWRLRGCTTLDIHPDGRVELTQHRNI